MYKTQVLLRVMECSDNLNSFVNTGRPGQSGADVVGGGWAAEKTEWSQVRQLSDRERDFQKEVQGIPHV